jgi:GxxExxY protein
MSDTSKKKKFEPLPKRFNDISGIIVDSALAVHKYYGPGLKESLYEESLILELTDRGLLVESQVTLPVHYYERTLKQRLILDLLVEKCVIVEIKSVAQILPVFETQLLTYLKITGLRLGLIINFNVPLVKDGIRRIIR